jgi:hypothetical protein
MHKTVAYIDFSIQGHRKHLMCSLIKATIREGAQAVCIINDPEPIKEWLLVHAPENLHQVIFVKYSRTSPKRLGVDKHLDDVYCALQYWRQYNAILKKAEKDQGIKIDAVVFDSIDEYLARWLPVFIQKMVFNYRWAGFYIHPRYLRKPEFARIRTQKVRINDVDYLFTSNKCIGLGVFDNGIVDALQFRLDKSVTLIPDISDISESVSACPYLSDIINNAGGRIIIGMIGISSYSGAVDMAKLAMQSDPEKYFYVFVGHYYESSYRHMSDTDRALIKKFRECPPANCFWKEGYLKDESEYNAVFKTFHILYMVYPEHFSSSNRLTKAAYFNKLVLASENYCVGENVVQYQLGEVAQPGNIQKQLEKLEILKDKITNHDLPVRQWQSYYDLNNDQVLQKRMKDLLGL